MRQIHHSLLLTNHTSFGKGTRMQGPYRHKVTVGGGGDMPPRKKREKYFALGTLWCIYESAGSQKYNQLY